MSLLKRRGGDAYLEQVQQIQRLIDAWGWRESTCMMLSSGSGPSGIAGVPPVGQQLVSAWTWLHHQSRGDPYGFVPFLFPRVVERSILLDSPSGIGGQVSCCLRPSLFQPKHLQFLFSPQPFLICHAFCTTPVLCAPFICQEMSREDTPSTTIVYCLYTVQVKGCTPWSGR